MSDPVCYAILVAVVLAFVVTAAHPRGPFAARRRIRFDSRRARRVRIIRRANFEGK